MRSWGTSSVHNCIRRDQAREGLQVAGPSVPAGGRAQAELSSSSNSAGPFQGEGCALASRWSRDDREF